MLSPSEVLPARLSDASGLALLLPRTGYEAVFLAVPFESGHIAVRLEGGDKAFTSFSTEEGAAWRGALVRDLEVGVDEGSLFDPDQELAPLGSLIREGTSLAMATRPPMASVIGRYLLPLLHNLPMGSPGVRLGFRKWQLTRGQGTDRRVMRAFELGFT